MIFRFKPIFLLFLSLLALAGCRVDSGRIDGTITYRDQGLEGIAVTLTGPESHSTVTDANGEFRFTSLSSGQYTVTPARGEYTFSPKSRTVEIKGASDEKQIHFEAAANQVPTAQPQTVHTDEDAPAAIHLEGSDPDGNSLTFRIISGPDHGSLSGTAPDLTYTPENDFSGTDAFSFVAGDRHLDSDPAAVTIEIAAVNDAPTAEDDTFTGASTPVTTGDVLANDSDPDNDTLTVSGFTQPSRGTAADNEDGTFTYTPGSGFTGQDSFTYTVSDSAGATDTAEVTIRVRPEVSITAQPQSIEYGSSAELRWTAEYADTVTIDPGIGQAGPSGTADVLPETDTTYTITATGIGGTATDSVSVEVTRPPQMTLSISPSVINHGESATLTWSASPADRVYINQDIGEVSASGSMTVTPDYTTTYELTSVNSDLTTHHGVSVKVLGNPPAPQPEGTFGSSYNDLVPEDASLAAYDPGRFVVITGKVADESGNPIPEVNVEIIDHPEYGSAATDASGRFSIPAEGGSLVVLSYKKDDYLTAHRKVEAPVMDVIPVAPVTLVTRDPESTFVDFNGDPDTVITHQSSKATDEFGSRSATMVFTGDTRAYELDKYGNRVRELNSITARATEYKTPQSMPAKLPPNSAYTYCTELEAEETTRIEFDKPVTVYVDNFLGFDVGGIVPVGYYDRDAANWVPADNGRVVELLDTDSDGTADALDADGDGRADDLNNNGNTSDEIAGLTASDHLPGDTCWRFQVRHFTPLDCNWPYGPSEDAIAPNPGGPPVYDYQRKKSEDCKTSSGSHVNDRSRILHQDIPVQGTGLSLHYTSNRTEGYKTVISVPASGEDLPPSLKRILVRVEVAGRVLEKTLSPLPNQNADITWDGRDYMGNLVKHTTTANVGVGFVYPAVYRNPVAGFGEPGIGWTGNDSRKEVTLWERTDITIFPPASTAKGTALRGWTLSPHHHTDPLSPFVLHKGDGTLANSADLNIIETQASFENRINCVEAGPAGAIFAATSTQIYRITEHGEAVVMAGTGDSGYSGDGGPASEAEFRKISGLAFSETGALYVADTRNHCLRKIDRSGIISTVAGQGEAGFTGDNHPAQGALLNEPADIEFDSSGNLYIADTGNNRIRKIDPRGKISTYAGGGDQRSPGGPAGEFRIHYLRDLAVDGRGNVCFVDRYNGSCRWVGWDRVLKIDRSGTVSHAAGSGCRGAQGSGYPATEVALGTITGLETDSDGHIYIAHYYRFDRNYNWGDYDSLIRKVNTDGIETIISGTRTGTPQDDSGIGYSGDGGPAAQALLSKTRDIVLDGAGTLYIADTGNQAIRTVGPPATFSQAMADGETAFATKNGVGQVMDSTGKHQKTIDTKTGQILYTFAYDTFGNEKKLTAITDQFGNTTTINRYADGTPYAVVSPDGLTTQLSIDADNQLTRITLPGGGMYDFAYTPGGLLTDKTDPNGNRYQYAYDQNGRITDTYDDHGGHWQFDRYVDEDGTIHNSVTTGGNNLTTYTDQTFSTGKYTSAIIGPAGGETAYTRSADGMTVEKDLSCGMHLNFEYDLDPEYRYRYVREMNESTPSGLTRTSRKDISYDDTNADDVPDLVTRTITINETRTATLENDILAGTKTVTSPEGRTTTSTYDPETLVTTSTHTPGIEPTDYYYYNDGKLESIVTGTRETAFTYGANGYLDSVTNPRGLTTNFINDSAGRVTRIDRPDGTGLEFVYDQNGNMTVLTNPSDVDHEFDYNAVDLKSAYIPPISGSYSYVYDKDRRLIQKNFPSGNSIYLDYTNPSDPQDKSRLWQIQTPEGNIDYTYRCANKVASVSRGAESISYGYDGKLVTSETLSGTLDQSLEYTYNNDFNPESFTYAGATRFYAYDRDGLLTGAGEFTISRYNNPGTNETGLPYSVADTSLNLERTFNTYGETAGEDTNVGGYDIYSWRVTDRYPDGKIKTKTETISGNTDTFEYTYDEMGRLATVTRNRTLVEEYTYDERPYGTRTYQVNTRRDISGRSLDYDDEDRLLSAGNADYQYNQDGFLESKTTSEGTTNYNYSSRGELLSVNLPDGTIIEYIHDPLGRRIAKKVDGEITKKYLWQGRTRLLAVYDGADNLLMRFKYADSRTPLAVEKEGTTYYLACNQVGSLRAVADDSGNVVKEITYDSFGYILNDTNPDFEIPLGFAGGLHDRDTGLVRFGHRDYDPDTGRWTAKDPILFKAKNTDLYGYVMNDPINFIDPLGLEWDMISSYRKFHGPITTPEVDGLTAKEKKMLRAIGAQACQATAEQVGKNIHPAIGIMTKIGNYILGASTVHAPKSKDDF
ncbi:MAG: tandem-95 repeat protein [Desulfobacteraceae bacterium]|nr:tandem-95 repeat protein [Desulfobacteraceae bacterium]